MLPFQAVAVVELLVVELLLIMVLVWVAVAAAQEVEQLLVK
jgi:hypothetical protein